MANLYVGITGGIGSGKSAASDWFATQQITIVDADIVAREVVAPGEPALAHIVARFGTEILLDDGHLDRRALRNIIFNDAQARLDLEAITHPLIRRAIIRQLAAATSRYAILVSPLLFESHQDQLVQRTVLIDAPEALQIERAMRRDHQTEQQIRQIIASQLSREAKIARADDVVMNDRDLDALYQQLLPLHHKYLQLSAKL